MSFNALNFFFAQVDLAWLIVVPVLCIAAAGCGGPSSGVVGYAIRA